MNSVLNLDITWFAGNFLSYIEHSFSSTVADWYDSLEKEGKSALRMMEALIAMFRKLRKEIETEFIEVKFNLKEKSREWQRKINNIELWDMRYLKN